MQDGLVQWWYGHNAVAFFLTTPILGIMYYFLPKAADRPVYSYRLSIIHFWSLVFIYIWAGPHHLLNTALPHWLQMLGMLFSASCSGRPPGAACSTACSPCAAPGTSCAPIRSSSSSSPAVTFYGMATFEGPLLSIRAVNALSHYTDWTIGHVHAGALGWNGFMAAGMFYWLAPRLWDTKLCSQGPGQHALLDRHRRHPALRRRHVGRRHHAGPHAQCDQRLGGTTLKYEFVETLERIQVFSCCSASIGGTLYLVGFILLAYNIWKTVRSGKPYDETARSRRARAQADRTAWRWSEAFVNDPLAYIFLGLVFMHRSGSSCRPTPTWPRWSSAVLLIRQGGAAPSRRPRQNWTHWYERLLENYLPFTVLVFVAVAIGGIVQIIPTVIVNRAKNVEDRLQKLYTPLELAGRDLYVSEGCYNCHSQMIRTLVPDVLRYGRRSR